jgi:hypothetical protein
MSIYYNFAIVIIPWPKPIVHQTKHAKTKIADRSSLEACICAPKPLDRPELAVGDIDGVLVFVEGL